MSRQPLYGRCWDDVVGDGHTSSRRGIVGSVGLNCETEYGQCVRVDVGYFDGKGKISKSDLRTVKKEHREELKNKYDEDVDKATEIHISIYLKDNPHFINFIDNVPVTAELIKALGNKEVLEFIKDQKIIEAI